MLQRKENVIMNKAEAFSFRIVKMYRFLAERKRETVISRQVLRSGTSIGANIVESRNAQSAADFVSKLSIALKEADETFYWLKVLFQGDYITEVQFESMKKDNEELIKLLVAIIKKMKEKASHSK